MSYFHSSCANLNLFSNPISVSMIPKKVNPITSICRKKKSKIFMAVLIAPPAIDTARSLSVI